VQTIPSTSSGGATSETAGGSTSSTKGPPDNGQDPSIIAAYRGSLDDFNAVANHPPIQANNLVLGNHMIGDKLQTVVNALLKLSLANEVNSGSLTSLHARVSQFDGTEAVIESCELDREAVINATTGRVIIPASNSTELVNELVQLTGGVWKVARGSRVGGGCS
jgi:hypothetical protein